ncbi:hypothetical protein T310_0146, partial [Rasamsonia emersonii CBS 393.64]
CHGPAGGRLNARQQSRNARNPCAAPVRLGKVGIGRSGGHLTAGSGVCPVTRHDMSLPFLTDSLVRYAVHKSLDRDKLYPSLPFDLMAEYWHILLNLSADAIYIQPTGNQ